MGRRITRDTMSLFALIMVTSAFCTSIRNLPTIAETGLQMIFFGLMAALCYFIPAALVSAELATAWPEQGGIYVWVRQAFGKRWGFFGIWLQWIYMTVSMIAMLYFIAGSLAFVFAPQLAGNRVFLVIVSLIVLWAFTWLNMRGLRVSSTVSTIGFLGGVLLPGLLIIFLGIAHILMGEEISLDFYWERSKFFPDFRHISTLVLLVGFMRAFAGIEASSAHANKVEHPRRNYPIAIFVVVAIGLLINILGSLSVAIVVPQEEISLVAGLMDAFTVFFAEFHMLWIIPFMGVLVAMGQMGGSSTWLLGPVKGLLSTAESGDLPPFFQKVNKKGMPSNLLIVQGCWISVVTTLLLLFSTINVAFWFSVALSMMIYVTMYFLMFLSGLRLRYKEPEVPRRYRIPCKNIGMWVVACLGMATMVFSFIVALFPPAQLPAKHENLYLILLVIGIIVIYAIPFLIYANKKPTWVPKKKEKESHE